MILRTTGRVLRPKFPITVTFDEHAPDVLAFEFHTPGGCDWTIGRDLLADGLMSEAGEMDVRIWPAPETDEICIEFNTPSGHLVVRTPWDAIATFVRMTYGLVPRGAEYAGVDWDALPWREPATGGAS